MQRHRSKLAVFWAVFGLYLWLLAAAAPANAGGLSLAHSYRVGSDVDRWVREFSQCAERESGIYIEVFSSGSFGRSRDLAAGVTFGKIDITVLPTEYLREFWPALAALDQPALIPDPQLLAEVSGDPELISRIDRMRENRELRLLGIGWQHMVLLTNNLDPNDLSGSIIRALDERTQKFLSELGANPIPIPLNETFPAMQFGKIDGAVVGLSSARRILQERGARGVILDRDFSPFAVPFALVMNANSARLGRDDLVEFLVERCSETTQEFNLREVEQLREFIENAANGGSAILQPDPWVRDMWHEAANQALSRDEGNTNRDAEFLFREFADR